MARIDSVDFGEIVVAGKSYYSDVSIDSKGRVEHRTKSHVVGADDIMPVLKDVDCIVIGTGMEGSVEVEDEVPEILENKGIKLFVEETRNAVDVFNGLIADKKRVAGIFHVTS
jgi:hypothetical protein